MKILCRKISVMRNKQNKTFNQLQSQMNETFDLIGIYIENKNKNKKEKEQIIFRKKMRIYKKRLWKIILFIIDSSYIVLDYFAGTLFQIIEIQNSTTHYFNEHLSILPDIK